MGPVSGRRNHGSKTGRTLTRRLGWNTRTQHRAVAGARLRLPASSLGNCPLRHCRTWTPCNFLRRMRSEEHTSELQSRQYLVCRLLLEKKKYTQTTPSPPTPTPLLETTSTQDPH